MRRLHKALLMPWTNKINYTQIVQQIAPANLIAYWPLAEASGTTILDASPNGRNGTYTGVTLGNAGIGDGRTSAGFDGATAYGNTFGASLSGAFTGDEITIALWLKYTPAAATRACIYMEADANNFYRMRMLAGTPMSFVRTAAGVSKVVSDVTYAGTGWSHFAVTASKSADQFKAYLNGAQDGATQTGLSSFAGALATCVIGAQSIVPATPWLGNEAHVAIWNTPFSAAQMLVLAAVP